MKGVLEKSGVLPDSSVGLDLTDIWLGVKTTLAVNPSIHCIRDPVNISIENNTLSNMYSWAELGGVLCQNILKNLNVCEFESGPARQLQICL